MKLISIIYLFCITIFSYTNVFGYIVVQNQYFPKPGKEREVYKLRLHASNVLANLGVPEGRVLKPVNINDRSYVMWECNYSSIEERERVANIVRRSAKFKSVESKMGTLLNGFQRITWEVEK